MTTSQAKQSRLDAGAPIAVSHRVLIVEDDALIRSMLADAAERAGLSVELAANAQQAVELATHCELDMAVLDYSLPDGSGIEVAEHLWTRYRVPFIFFSAFADDRIVERAIELGALGYLLKPIDPRTLVPMLRAACARAIERRGSSAAAVRTWTAAKRDAARRERARLAAELHDGLGQDLTAIGLLVGSLERSAQRARAEELVSDAARLRQHVAQAFTTCRALSHRLFGGGVAIDDLGRALKALAEGYSAMSDCACTYRGPPSTLSTINGKKVHHLYRLAQEAIGNALRHSGASKIVVELIVRDGRIRLSIRDNGCGCKKPAGVASSGIGLRTMRSRASALGGTLELLAIKPRGTEVRVDLPLRQRTRVRRRGAAKAT